MPISRWFTLWDRFWRNRTAARMRVMRRLIHTLAADLRRSARLSKDTLAECRDQSDKLESTLAKLKDAESYSEYQSQKIKELESEVAVHEMSAALMASVIERERQRVLAETDQLVKLQAGAVDRVQSPSEFMGTVNAR